MEPALIIFSTVMILSVISFITAICVLIYYKQKDFKLKGERTLSALSKKFTSISVVINLSVLIVMVASFLSTMISPYFLFLGIILFFVACFISIIAGPAVSLSDIVFSAASIKREDEGKRAYIFVSCLSMLISLVIAFLYIYLILPV